MVKKGSEMFSSVNIRNSLMLLITTFLLITLSMTIVSFADEDDDGFYGPVIKSVVLKDGRTLYGYKNSEDITNFPSVGDKIITADDKEYVCKDSEDGLYFYNTESSDVFLPFGLIEPLASTGSHYYVFLYADNIDYEVSDIYFTYYTLRVEIKTNNTLKSIDFPDYYNKPVELTDGIDMSDLANHTYALEKKFPKDGDKMVLTLSNGSKVNYIFSRDEYEPDEGSFIAQNAPSNTDIPSEIDLYSLDMVYNDTNWSPSNSGSFKVFYEGVGSSNIAVKINPDPITIEFKPVNNIYSVNESDIKDSYGHLNLNLRGNKDIESFFKAGDKIIVKAGVDNIADDVYTYTVFDNSADNYDADFVNNEGDYIDASILLPDETKYYDGTLEEGRNKVILNIIYGFAEKEYSTEFYINVLKKNTHVHSLVLVPEKAATCEQAGNSEYYKCKTCNAMFADQYEQKELKGIPAIPALGHKYSDWKIVKAPTCGSDGEEQRVCEHDSSHVLKRAIPKTEMHTWGDWKTTKESTEDEEGIQERVCTVCNKKEIRSLPKSEHVHVNGEPVKEHIKESTCTESGSYEEVVYCKKCKEELSRTTVTTSPLGHKYGDWQVVKEATCKEDGERQRVCEHDKSHVLKEIIKKTNNHTWGEWVVTKEATEDEEGVQERTCSVCKEKETKAIPKKEHVHVKADPVKENEKAATCTEQGSYDMVVYCSKCKEELSRTTVPTDPIGHDWGEWQTVKEPTETENGTRERVCKHDKTHKQTETIPKLQHKHKGTKVEAVPATCTQDGTVEHYKCGCGQLFSDEACTKQIEDIRIPATGHKWSEWEVTKEATCGEEGEKQRVCENDKTHTEKATIKKKVEHTWGEWKVTKEPTETEEGIKERVCSVCGAKDTESVPVKEHEHTAGEPTKKVIKEATCTENGSYEEVVKCSSCGEEMSHKIVESEPLGHKWGDWTTTKEAMCKEEGEKQRVCERDKSHVEKQIIPKVTEHKWGEWKVVKEATDTEEGLKERECTICKTKETETIEKQNHVHQKAEPVKENVKEATCTEKGSYEEVIYCSICKTELSRKTVEVEPLGHDYGEWVTVKEPTCKEEGLRQKVCKHDSTHVIEEAIPVSTEHVWGEWTTAKEPTEEEEGLKERVCIICGEKETVKINKKVHQHSVAEVKEEVVKEATCTEKGAINEADVCKCGEVLGSQLVETEALGHDWSDWTITKEATEYETGEKTRKCTRCGIEETETIMPSWHTHVIVYVSEVPATEEKDGVREHFECACGEKFADVLGEREISDSDLIIPRIVVSYETTSETPPTWVKGSDKDLEFHFVRSNDNENTINKFIGITIDNKPVTSYEVRSGSVIIILRKDVLDKLSVGAHSLKAKFEDGEAEQFFEIASGQTSELRPEKKPEKEQVEAQDKGQTSKEPVIDKKKAPKTGDTNSFVLWMSLLSATVICIYLKKRH